MLRAISFVLGLCLANVLLAEPMTGIQIIEKAKQNGKGFKDLVHEVKMLLVDESGGSTEREMLMKAMTEAGGDSYSMLIFTAPQREKGISLLTVSAQGSSDKQYLYLPSSRRVKRITSSNKGSSFRGSEFTFEDLSDQKTEDYRFERVQEEACATQSCYVVDRFPKSDESSYSKTRMWIDTEFYRLIKAEFYDRDNKLLKTMQTRGYELFEGQYWNPEEVVMANIQTGKSTKMLSLSLKMNSGLRQSEFTELAMQNWR
ncbi:MAG: outer membrane lipoprotein-sorting protein [Pseudomonadota bacterium]|nr:outer membrane lipoprotein-sorting protein [Pseudomonadota bacterium]